jgi:hypothetical protein
MLGVYGVYRFLIPMEMRKALYGIEQINLYNKEVDISEFRELIPHTKYTSFLIAKGSKISGTLKFKNGSKGIIIIDDMYGSFEYSFEGENKGFYYFEGEDKQKMIDLIEKTYHR